MERWVTQVRFSDGAGHQLLVIDHEIFFTVYLCSGIYRRYGLDSYGKLLDNMPRNCGGEFNVAHCRGPEWSYQYNHQGFIITYFFLFIGWIGFVLILFCCFVSAYTGDILGKCWIMVVNRHPEFDKAKLRYPYPTIGQEAFGKWGR
jgi:hypothetical protein